MHLGESTPITTVQDKEIVLTSVDGQNFRMKIADLAEAVRQVMPVVTSERNGIMGSEIYNKTVTERATVINMNDITKSGVYQIGNECSNIPEVSWSIAVVFIASTYVIQLITPITNPTRLYIRSSSSGGEVFSVWSRFSFV